MIDTKVLKRDGRDELFHPYKIGDAITAAFKSVGKEVDGGVLIQVLASLEAQAAARPQVEGIQDLIERTLFDRGHFEVLQSFTRYRFLHKMQRERLGGATPGTTYVDCCQTIDEYINGTDWRIKANSNTSYSNAGLINNSAGKVIANYWLDRVYTPEEGAAHRSGDYHIHDLDVLAGYCAGWSLRQLLNEGFNGVRGRVSSRPPRHLREALGQMANFLGILQSEWAGAQAFSSFDTYLAPYVFRDRLELGEVRKAIRSFVYNLNVPARWGQSPFTNITLDWTVPRDLAEHRPMANNAPLLGDLNDAVNLRRAQERGVDTPEELCYRHFQPEMDLINRAFYEVMTEGDAQGQPFTFPIPTVNITEDFDWNGPNTDVLFDNTAKIGSSYFQNFVGSQYRRNLATGALEPDPDSYKPHAVRSMCCRLQLDLRELQKRGGGLFGSAEMTGSIGVVTINMARLGYLHRGDLPGLMAALEHLMDLGYSTLEKKRAFITQLFERGLYPYTKRYLPGFRNHFSTIGVNGMNEMLRNFSLDTLDLTQPESRLFCARILRSMRERIRGYQEKSGHLYNLEATPAEGTTYRFAREDKKRFPDILQAGDAQGIYYTNSSQLPVDFTDDPFEAIELQDELQCLYTGGTVLHLYMSEPLRSPQSCRELVKRVVGKFRLPYITITPLFSVCDRHGRLPGEHEFCPHCDEELVAQHC